MKNVNFPSNIQDFQHALKIAIEQYQGSPVKNQNKLNECTAESLGFKNYDSLAASLRNVVDEGNTILMPMFVTLAGIQPKIDNVYIDDEVFDEEMVDYKLVEREEQINDLIMFISEAQNDFDRRNDALLMREDLDTLMQWDDEYVFSSLLTNEFVSPSQDTERFNEICNEILEVNKTLEEKTNKRTSSYNY